MKFTKFGKALLMSALSVAVVLGISSCVQSYTVGYLYVTGTITAQPGGNGIITGFDIDHNTGKLPRKCCSEDSCNSIIGGNRRSDGSGDRLAAGGSGQGVTRRGRI